MMAGRLGIIRGVLEGSNPKLNQGANAALRWEMCWTYGMELLRYVEELEKCLGHIATTPTLDMPPAQLAVIQGIKEMARRAVNGY